MRQIRNPKSTIRNLLLGFAISCGNSEPAAYQSVADKIMITIPRGATYYQALDTLESRGLVKNRDWFSVYARVRGLPANLKSGVYLFEADESWTHIISTLKKGRGMESRFTVLEGMMGFEVAELARGSASRPQHSRPRCATRRSSASSAYPPPRLASKATCTPRRTSSLCASPRASW